MSKTKDIKKQLKNLSDEDGYIGYYEARDFLQSNLPDLDEFDLDNAMEELEPDYSNYEDKEVFIVEDVEDKYDELKTSYAKGGMLNTDKIIRATDDLLDDDITNLDLGPKGISEKLAEKGVIKKSQINETSNFLSKEMKKQGFYAKGGKTKEFITKEELDKLQKEMSEQGYDKDGKPYGYDNLPFEKGGKISDLIVGNKVGHLRPHTGRYEYSEITEINGNEVKLVHRHPTKRYWDNYFEMGKDQIEEFIDTPSKDFKDGRPLMKIKKSYEKGGSILEKSYNPQEVFDMITKAGTWEEFMSADGDGRLEIYNNAKYRFEKGGKTISREEVVEVLKDKLEDVLEDANEEYEGQEIEGEEVEYESRDGFIPYTDGGYQYEFFTYENYLTGSGKTLPTITLQEELSRREKMLYEEAQEELWNQEKDEEGFRDKFPTPESVNWNDLEDYDYELAETFDDLSRAYDDSIRFEVEALYYKPDNDKSIDGKHTIVLSGSVNMETPYHRRGNMEDFIEEKFTFDSIKDLEDKLDKSIPKIEAWFDGDSYKQGKELKMGRFEKGGKTEKNYSFTDVLNDKRGREIIDRIERMSNEDIAFDEKDYYDDLVKELKDDFGYEYSDGLTHEQRVEKAINEGVNLNYQSLSNEDKKLIDLIRQKKSIFH